MALPKSVKKERIVANAAVDAFVIEDADVQAMDALDEHLVTGTPCGSRCGDDHDDNAEWIDWDPTNCE